MAKSFTIDNTSEDYDNLIPTNESSMVVTFLNGLIGGPVETDENALNYGVQTPTPPPPPRTIEGDSIEGHLYVAVTPTEPFSYFALVVEFNTTQDKIFAVQVAELNSNPDGFDPLLHASLGEYVDSLADPGNSLEVDLGDIDSDFNIAGGGGGGGVPCLTQTCNVLTPNGYQNVSSLKEGDIVTTSDGRNVAIEQLLTSKVNASRITPRVIKANAYGKNMPIVDTHLSDNHAYQVNGVWKLPKNEKLTQQWNEKYVTYYHLKLPNYTQDFLVVNGMNMEGWDGLTPKEFRPYMWVKHGKGVVLKHL